MNARTLEVDYRGIFQGRIRAIETRYGALHNDLLGWGEWSRHRYPGRPTTSVSGVWSLPGETDPDRDPDAAPAFVAPPIDERAVIALDVRIHKPEFLPMWRRILRSSYIRRIPEYQRPDDSHMGHETFIEQFTNLMEALDLGVIGFAVPRQAKV